MNNTVPEWKSTLMNTKEPLSIRNLMKMIQKLSKQSVEIQNNISPILDTFTKVNSVTNTEYFLQAFNENIKIAKTLIYRIKEMSTLVKKLQNRRNNVFCSLQDFNDSISIIEKRIQKNSKLSFADSATRKVNPQWYFDQLQLDIQTLGTLLNTLNIDFNIFNNADILTSQNALKQCTNTPHISTDTSYTDDIKNTYKYCKDGVCNALSSYMTPTHAQKLKRGKKKTRKKRSKK